MCGPSFVMRCMTCYCCSRSKKGVRDELIRKHFKALLPPYTTRPWSAHKHGDSCNRTPAWCLSPHEPPPLTDIASSPLPLAPNQNLTPPPTPTRSCRTSPLLRRPFAPRPPRYRCRQRHRRCPPDHSPRDQQPTGTPAYEIQQSQAAPAVAGTRSSSPASEGACRTPRGI